MRQGGGPSYSPTTKLRGHVRVPRIAMQLCHAHDPDRSRTVTSPRPRVRAAERETPTASAHGPLIDSVSGASLPRSAGSQRRTPTRSHVRQVIARPFVRRRSPPCNRHTPRPLRTPEHARATSRSAAPITVTTRTQLIHHTQTHGYPRKNEQGIKRSGGIFKNFFPP